MDLPDQVQRLVVVVRQHVPFGEELVGVVEEVLEKVVDEQVLVGEMLLHVGLLDTAGLGNVRIGGLREALFQKQLSCRRFNCGSCTFGRRMSHVKRSSNKLAILWSIYYN